MAKTTNNYTLGRSEFHFAQFKPGTMIPGGERYIGNTPEASLSIEEEKLEHFSADHGVREKDDAISLQTNRTLTFVTDNIHVKNVALSFFGSAEVVSTPAATGETETLSDVEPGLTYQLGTTDTTPTGVRNVSNVVIKKGATTYVAGTDYEVLAELARVEILEGGAIAKGDDLDVTYDVAAHSFERVLSGSQAIEGSLRIVAYNAKGQNFDYFFPRVSISPNGDRALKGDEWQQIPFTVEILKKGDLEAIYYEGRPFQPAP